MSVIIFLDRYFLRLSFPLLSPLPSTKPVLFIPRPGQNEPLIFSFFNSVAMLHETQDFLRPSSPLFSPSPSTKPVLFIPGPGSQNQMFGLASAHNGQLGLQIFLGSHLVWFSAYIILRILADKLGPPCTQANIHRDTYYVYMHVHTDRRHRRQLKLTSCWPTPRGAVCMSVCECVPLISLNTKYACISVFVCFYILPVVQLQCSFERLYKNFAISPNLLPVKRCMQCCIYGSLLLCERHSNDFVVQSTVQWGMSIYSSLRAISQQRRCQ